MPIVNAPQLISMTNDIGGYVKVAGNYMWIKFSDEPGTLQYRINPVELLEKFGRLSHLIKPCEGVKFVLGLVEDGEKMLTIELHRPGFDNDKAVISLAELLRELYYIKEVM